MDSPMAQYMQAYRKASSTVAWDSPEECESYRTRAKSRGIPLARYLAQLVRERDVLQGIDPEELAGLRRKVQDLEEQFKIQSTILADAVSRANRYEAERDEARVQLQNLLDSLEE